MMELENVIFVDDGFKEFVMEKEAKRIGSNNVMKPLYYAINSIDDLVVHNSCQGELNQEDDITAISFMVINDNYKIANDLFVYLKSEFGSMLDCNIQFISHDTVAENKDGKLYIAGDKNEIALLYNIEFVDVQNWVEDGLSIIKKVAKKILEYAKEI